MKLYFNPISSYSQKALIAFYEKGIEFTPEVVHLMDPGSRAAYAKIHPVCKVPLLEDDDGKRFPETSIIIELLDQRWPDKGPRLIPEDKQLALETRLWDRLCDNYLNDPMQKIFFDGRRPADKRDPLGVEQAKERLAAASGMLDQHLTGRTWLAADTFTLADCAAAPALSYMRRVQPFEPYPQLAAYAARLFERPSFTRVLKEVAPILQQLGMA